MPQGDLRWKRYPRTTDGLWHAIEDLRDAVDDIATADQVAQAVTDALAAQRRRFFTVPERVLALILSFIVTASSVVAAYYSVKG